MHDGLSSGGERCDESTHVLYSGEPVISLFDLHDCFVEALDGPMIERGWERDPRGDGQIGVNGVMLGMFRRLRGPDFYAHVSFEYEETYPGKMRGGQTVMPAFMRAAVEVGLRHLPADRVQRLLGSRTNSYAAIDLRVVAGSLAETAELSTLAAAESGASQLIDAVDRHALDTLDRYTDIDAFLRLYSWATPETQRFVVPAVLGSSGRIAELESWLAANGAQRRRRKGEPSGYREYERKLRDWVKAGAQVPRESELPPDPPLEPLPPPALWAYEPSELGGR